MTKINFGTLRYIELFNPSLDDVVISYWNNFIVKIVEDPASAKHFFCIGCVNDIHPIMRTKLSSHIMVHDGVSENVKILAQSMEQFTELIHKTLAIWQPYLDYSIIPITNPTLLSFAGYRKELRSIPDINHEWWENFAFRELMIQSHK